MIRKVLGNLSLVALLVCLAGLSWQALRVLKRATPTAERKQQAAERVLAYRVTHQQGPRFLLDGGRTRLKLSSSAIVVPEKGFDASRQVAYRFALTVSSAGRTVWTADVAITSRQSKQGFDGTQWAYEGAWSLDHAELTDERITIVDLPALPVNSILELQLVGEGEALVRVFQADARDAGARDRVAVRWDDRSTADRLSASTYAPWSLLDPREQQARLKQHWTRLSAIGEAGVSFATRALFVSDFRTPFPADDIDGIVIASDRSAAVNLQGPARISVVPPSGSVLPLQVERVGASRAIERSIGAPLTIDLPAGPHSLLLSTTSSVPLALVVRAAHDQWIAPFAERAATDIGVAVPDRVRIPVLVLGPTSVATLPTYGLSDEASLGRTVRVDARVIIPPDRADLAATGATLTVRFLGADGRELGRDHHAIVARRSLFERLDWNGVDAALTEPTSVRVLAPRGAALVEIASDRDVAVGLFRWLPGDIERAQPYTQLPGPGLMWRYAPLLHRAWYPVSPDNHEPLAIARRVAILQAQVRIDGVDDDALVIPAATPTTYETLAFTGTERQRVREPIAADEIDNALRAWDPGALTALGPLQPRVLDFRATLSTRPRLSWAAPPSVLGAVAHVTVGDVQRTVRLDARFGSAELRDLPAGPHRVVIDAPREAQLWINRPSVGERWGLFHDRTVFALGRRPLTTRVWKADGEQLHVYAVVYAPEPVDARIRLTIDGGTPTRRVGIVDRLSVAEVTTALASSRAPAARLIDLGGRWAGTPRVVELNLLDDLLAGSHRIEIAAETGPPMWVRLAVTRDRIPPTEASP